MRNLKFLPLIFLIIFSSCSKEKTYDHSKAVSAFLQTNPEEIDPALAEVKIKIPRQKDNNSWDNISANDNQNSGNFAFDGNFKKRTILSYNYHLSAKNRLIYSPVIADDKAYVLDYDGILRAVNLKTNKQIFKKRIFPREYFKNFQNAKISYFDGKIFAVLGSNKIAAVEAENGKVLWSRIVSSVTVSTPSSDGKLVYITTNDNKTYAFSTKDGALEWTHFGINKNMAILGSANPVIYKNYLLSSYSSGELYAINKDNGQTIWSADLNANKTISSDFYLNDIDATPIVENDIVYAIGNGAVMGAIKISNGDFIWKKELSGISDLWLAGDFLYTINNDSKLLAVYKKTGGIKWMTQLPDFKNKKKPKTKYIYNGVTMAGNTLIITSHDGKLITVNPLDGEIIKEAKLGGNNYHNPVMANNAIYINLIKGLSLQLARLN